MLNFSLKVLLVETWKLKADKSENSTRIFNIAKKVRIRKIPLRILSKLSYALDISNRQ